MADKTKKTKPSTPKKPDEAAILTEAKKRYERARDTDRPDRLEAIEDKNFLNGKQWPEEIEQARKTAKRPCLVINQLPKFIDQVEGDFRQNKPMIKVKPQDSVSDPDKADVLEGLIRSIEANSGSGIVYGTALNDIASCGRGAFRVLTEYTDDDSFDQDIKLEEISNVFSVYFDPDAVKFNREDGKYLFVTKEINRDEFEAEYPDAKPIDFDTEIADTDSVWFTEDKVLIAEYWRIVEGVEITICQLKNGETVEKDKLKAGDTVVKERKIRKPVIETMIINGAEILEGPTRWLGKYIPIIGVKGKEIDINGRRYTRGIIRNARDPQRMYNYWRTAETEAVALAPKNPYKATKKQIEGYETQWNSVSTTSKPYILYNPDPKAQGLSPTREQPVQYYAGYQHNSELSAKEMMDTASMYESTIGEKSNEKSGEAIKQRRAGSDRANVAYTDNLARAMKHAGRIILDLIPYIYDGARTIRILGPDFVEKYVTINSEVDLKTEEPLETSKVINMENIGRYDVVVDVGPSYTTKRLEDLDAILEFMRGLPPQQAEVISDLVAGNMDWLAAEEIAERLRITFPPELRALIEKETGEISEDEKNQGELDPDMEVPLEVPQGQDMPPGMPEPEPDPIMDIQIQQEQAKLDKMVSDAEKADFEASIKEVEYATALAEAERARVPLDVEEEVEA